MMTARRASDERGYVIVMVLGLMVVALAFGAAMIALNISSHQLTTHDARTRRAQQAADAGVQAELYYQSESNLGASYNFNGGLLGLTSFTDCLPLQLDANLQITGFASASASTAGVCPSGLLGGTKHAPFYLALGNHAYVESEFLSNTKQVGGSGLTDVEFPEIVSVGCDTLTPSSCATTPAPSTNVYSRELALLQPTGPIQAVEATGNVAITGVSLLGLSVAGAINGDIMAGGNLTLPTLGVNVNLTNLASGVLPTFGYAGSLAGNLIGTANKILLSGGKCTAGNPTALCYIQRPAPSVTRPSVDTLSTICPSCSSITCTSCGASGGYNSSTDTFSMTTGAASFPTGNYYLCNFNATGGSITAPSTGTGPVRIFILAPNSPPCSTNGYTETSGSWNGGNFVATKGVNNITSGFLQGNLASTVNPSAVQIYDEGDGSYDNATSVTIGSSGNSAALTQSMIIYAPASTVNVTTSVCNSLLLGLCTILNANLGGVFEGSIVGDNVNLNAGVITQDFDIGNYQIESGANAFRVDEVAQCDGSVTNLLGSSVSADTGGC